MDEGEARAAIETSSALRPERVSRIEGGWASDTFDVDGRWIFRFPRTDEVARGLEREIRLLPMLAKAVSFRVPSFELMGTHRGRPFAGYEKIEGRPLSTSDLDSDETCASVARALSELHHFPIGEARRILGEAGTIEAWREDYEGLRAKAAAEVRPVIDDAIWDTVERGLDRFIDTLDFAPALVHRDLGVEHLLVDEAGRVAGVIDFEDASVGDPLIDFVGLLNSFGSSAVQRIAAAYGRSLDAAAWHQMRFYAWMGSVHAIFYGLETEDASLVEGATTELRKRLAAAGS
jgi:aminoglycoside 2''-phosphotransferase